VLWAAFFIRPALGLAFGTYRPGIIAKPGMGWIAPVILSTSLGTLAVGGSAYLGYFTGWFENFPRSIFALDWFVITALFLLARLAFRRAWAFKPGALPAQT
jgi:hypothetical protein